MEWEFINSVTIQLAKIVFQNFLYSKKGLPEQNLLLDESQEKIWDLIVIKNFEKWHAVQLICCVKEYIYRETINYYWFNQ